MARGTRGGRREAQEKEGGGTFTWSEQTAGVAVAATAARAEDTAAPDQAMPGPASAAALRILAATAGGVITPEVPVSTAPPCGQTRKGSA